MGISVNSRTGQVAVYADDAGPQKSNVQIFEPGMYMINARTGQIAIPTAEGKYETHDLKPEQINALHTPEAILARQTGGVGMISEGTPNPSLAESTLRGFQQGVTLGTSDEIAGGTQAALSSLYGENVPNQASPVTGQPGGAGQAYLRGAYEERRQNAAAKENNPRAYKSAFMGGALLPGMALPGNTMLQAGTSGAVQGGLLGGGLADTEDPKRLLLGIGFGAGGGAAGGLLLKTLYNMVFAHNNPTGLAYSALDDSTPGGIMNMRVRPGSAPAELDPGMANNLRGAASMNSAAAGEAIPAARNRMQDVNQAIIDRVNQELSPDDAALLLQQIQQRAQTQNQAAYAAANASPTRVGLTPDITQRPVFQDAMVSANAAAANELPPRAVDPTDLGVRDIDLIDRVLQSTQRAAGEAHGDPSIAAQTAKALIPARGEVADTVRTVADQAFPELASARAQAAASFAQERAIETGGRWLTGSTSPEEVAAQFAAMGPAEQQGALAAFATDIKNTLGTKTARANLGNFFEKNAVAQKLQAVGVPEDIVARIVQGGQGARSVLDALEGGSMTARNIAFKEAMEPTFSQVKSGDLVAGAVMNSPAVTLGLPILRAAGERAKQGAAEEIIRALTTPGSAGITSLINRAPQTWSGILNAPARTAGSILGADFAAGAR